jgi:hypothetical protein
MTQPYITDLSGKAQPWLWLVETFGDVTYHPAAPKHDRPLYRITRLHAGTTGAVLTARVIDEEGRPLPRLRIVRVWTRTLEDPHSAPSHGPAAGPTCPLADAFAVTDADEVAEFAAGRADVYQLPAAGRSTLWVADPSAPSDALEGVGILRAPEGRRLCLHITWQRQRPPRAIQPARWLHPSLVRAKTRGPNPAQRTRGFPAQGAP